MYDGNAYTHRQHAHYGLRGYHVYMPIVVSIANQKGGCGKTTTAMNLAGGLSRAKYRTLVVDADKQASATIWSLSAGQGSLPFAVMPAQQIDWDFTRLSSLDQYDLILIDCPPGAADDSDKAGERARAALRASDAVLIPIRPSTLDFSATGPFVRFLLKEAGKRPIIPMVLVNARQVNVIGRQARDRAEDLFAKLPGAIILESQIGLRTPITEVSGSGLTIFEYAPSSDARREYAQLTKEIIQCLAQTSK